MAASYFCLTLDGVVDRECITNLGTCILNSVLVFIVFIAAILMCSESSSGKRRGGVRFQEHNSRWILTFCAAAIHLFELADGVMVLVRRHETRQNLHPMLGAVTSLVTVVVAIYFYHKVEEQGKARRLSALLVFWPCIVALKTAKLVVLYEKGLGAKHVTLQTTWAGVVVYTAIFILELSIFAQKVKKRVLCCVLLVLKPAATTPNGCNVVTGYLISFCGHTAVYLEYDRTNYQGPNR
ncbi:ATP-binding cassette sub-family C member 9-like [Ixodes scapularis]|uniref:ATP-binding cassette sub-family C member 9-like n=1 Tax=Ixodes scapularis TaxID=6945 RepID=UPI001AD7668F|nr:ATP-binding cassette sub-family C member 9-like [Ixodes scapularis]